MRLDVHGLFCEPRNLAKKPNRTSLAFTSILCPRLLTHNVSHTTTEDSRYVIQHQSNADHHQTGSCHSPAAHCFGRSMFK
jgi:hypothetical protein